MAQQAGPTITPTPTPTPVAVKTYDIALPEFLKVGAQADLFTVLQQILNTLVLITIVTAIIYLILNGLKFVTSGGDQAKAQEAQKGITYAIIGIIIAISSSLLVQFVLQRLNFNIVWF